VSSSESLHDRKVRKIAAAYWGMGYRVWADISGYDRPAHIRSRVPDIVATKGKTTRIVEVETDQTFDRHKDQRDIFRDYADGRSRTWFRWTKVLDED